MHPVGKIILSRRVFTVHCIIQILLLDINKLFYKYTYGIYLTNSIKQARKRICRKMLTTDDKLLVYVRVQLISVRAGEKIIHIFDHEDVEQSLYARHTSFINYYFL